MTVELINSMGDDQSVVNAARVSFAKDASNFTEDQNIKLLNYLAKHNHWSPYAHVFLSFRVKVPLFVAMQLDKHTVGLVTNSVSRRYVDDEPEFWFPTEWRGRPVNAKQGSSGIVELTIPLLPEAVVKSCIACYNTLLEDGVAPEQARMILPMNTMMERVWSGSLMAFARVCKLRLDPHAQEEVQEVARHINRLIPKQFEHSWKALLDA